MTIVPDTDHFKHCDDYIDDETQPACLRNYLRRARSPCHGMLDKAPFPRLFATYIGAEPWRGYAKGVHAKVEGGELVAGGGPSCWQCSKFLLSVGVSGIWLYEKPQIEDGAVPPAWHFYTPVDFHMETLSNLDLPAYKWEHP